jgi:hypothetical protein
MNTVILNYRADFAPMIQAGVKPHTIRPRRNDGRDPLPGDLLQHYAKWGTKDAYLLREEFCTFTAEVTIQRSVGNVHHVLIGGQLISQHDVEVMATVEGFRNGADFVQFFNETYGLPFTGLLIGWEPIPVYVTRH